MLLQNSVDPDQSDAESILIRIYTVSMIYVGSASSINEKQKIS